MTMRGRLIGTYLKGIHEDTFLFFDCQSDEISTIIVRHAKLFIRNTVFFVNVGFKKATRAFVIGNLLFEDRLHEGRIVLLVGHAQRRDGA